MILSQIIDIMRKNVHTIASYLDISDEAVQYWIDKPETMLDFGILEAGVIAHVARITISQFVEALVEVYPMDTWVETTES